MKRFCSIYSVHVFPFFQNMPLNCVFQTQIFSNQHYKWNSFAKKFQIILNTAVTNYYLLLFPRCHDNAISVQA